LVAEAQLTVNIKDENNQSPIFTNVESGNVLEHEKAGTPVMQVSAVDNDGTYPNNRVRYKISDRNAQGIKDKFEINADTGMIYIYVLGSGGLWRCKISFILSKTISILKLAMVKRLKVKRNF
jgi:hypothetical protein